MLKSRPYRKSLIALVCAGLLSAAAACGSSSSSGTPATTSGSSGSTAASGACGPAAAGTKVTLSFTSWLPGMQKTVDLWNSKNPDIQVNYKQVPAGDAGAYQTYTNQLKAGNPDDLGMITYDRLATFRLQDGLFDIGQCAPIAGVESRFDPWTIAQASFGEKGSLYGVPQDSSPLVFYYRKDLFDKNKIPVPATWADFAAAAVKIKGLGGVITNLSPSNGDLFAGLSWQNGATWFTQSSGSWKVDLTGAKTATVADFWQKLIDQKLVTTNPGLGDVEWSALAKGTEWGTLAGPWGAQLVQTGVPSQSGNFAVATLPQWTAGANAGAYWGGSSTVVFKGSKHPYEAAEFAAWAFSDPAALALNSANGGVYPAATAGQSTLPALTQPSKFFGGQVIGKIFHQAGLNVDPAWQFGPTMSQTYGDLDNGLGAAANGSGTIAAALKTAQDKTITAMKSQSIDVTAGS